MESTFKRWISITITMYIYIYNYSYPLVIEHNYGKSPCVMGKLTVSMVIFQFAMAWLELPWEEATEEKRRKFWSLSARV